MKIDFNFNYQVDKFIDQPFEELSEEWSILDYLYSKTLTISLQ